MDGEVDCSAKEIKGAIDDMLAEDVQGLGNKLSYQFLAPLAFPLASLYDRY